MCQICNNFSFIFSDIPIPLYVPTACISCTAANSMLLSCGPKKVAVVTKEGRFDLNTTQFVCSVCNASQIASNEDYLCSGYWPGSLSNNSYFIEEDLLGMWHHLRHKTPGTSERKFIETLQEISLENDRVSGLTCRVNIRLSKHFFTYRIG